jgi:hypothetical protein
MRAHRRITTTALGTLALAGLGLLGLTACSGGATSAPPAPVAANGVAPGPGVVEAALAGLGFDPVELGLPAADPAESGAPGATLGAPGATPEAGKRDGKGDKRHKRPLRRELLRGRVLHAEAVVKTKDGTQTVVSQRGEITKLDDRTITVRSADDFTRTWVLGDKLRVVERRRVVQPADLTVGAEIGVAGVGDGERPTAGLIVRRP